MIQSTRFRLTAWYLLIIMAISIFFSVLFFLRATNEIDRALRMQRLHMQHPQVQAQIEQTPDGVYIENVRPLPPPDPQVLEEERTRLLLSLLSINVIILFLSGVAGYFLAGRTLRPIQVMMDEQNRFVADASHELRTPITSLKTAIEVNLRDKQLTSKEAKEVLMSNLEEVNTLQVLSDNLLQLINHQQLALPIQLTEISLDTIVTTALKKVSILAQAKDISIDNQVTKDTVKGDEKTLVDLLIILFDNAIKYSPEHTTIHVTSQTKKDTVLMSIQDEGIGIEKKDLPHIFDRFYRADTSRSKQNVSGYGLGLAIAKRIVDLHNGNIVATSKSGEGTTFTITLPKKL